MNLRTEPITNLRGEWWVVYDGNKPKAALPDEKSANAYMFHLRIVERKHNGS